jgi:hypothetical protein
MDIVHVKDLAFKPPPLQHRGSSLSFKDLFRGTEGTPENYYLSLARQGTFYSPVHRHNFDQFRYAVRGDVSLAPDMLLRQGELSYHSEGVHYGPQHDVDGDRDVLVLQFGGASGQGYLSFDQLARGQLALKETGHFEGGKYYAHQDDGESHDDSGKDGFEALWESFNGRPLVYPSPRFDRTLLVKPENFAWKPCSNNKTTTPTGSASVKLLGVFTERATTVQMIRLEDGGEMRVEPSRAIQLLYVLRGEGLAALSERKTTQAVVIEEESAIRLNPDSEPIVLSSASRVDMIHFVLPMLS